MLASGQKINHTEPKLKQKAVLQINLLKIEKKNIFEVLPKGQCLPTMCQLPQVRLMLWGKMITKNTSDVRGARGHGSHRKTNNVSKTQQNIDNYFEGICKKS